VIGAVGNDVVDLREPGAEARHLDASFVSRVCADDERARATTAADLWALFAAKEAAYKAFVKLGAPPTFAPHRLRVAADRSSVTWKGKQPADDLRVALAVTQGAEHVHAVAWSGAAAPIARVACARGAPRDEGQRARALLCRLVARSARLDRARLRVVRDPVDGAWDGYGPPRVEHAGARLDVDVSLSHDGRFVAAAAIVACPRIAKALRAPRPRAHGLPALP
jgi:phosphopantetheinyl transferase (holo-ACP synthase)